MTTLSLTPSIPCDSAETNLTPTGKLCRLLLWWNYRTMGYILSLSREWDVHSTQQGYAQGCVAVAFLMRGWALNTAKAFTSVCLTK